MAGPRYLSRTVHVVHNARDATLLAQSTGTLSLPTFAAAVARVNAGTGDAKVAFIGDSTTVGAGTTVYETKNPAARFAARYAGATTRYGSTWGKLGSTSYDGRLTIGSGWTHGVSFNSNGLGGGGFYTNTGGGTLSFTPAGSFDTIKVWYLRLSSKGTVSVDVDGGSALGTINGAGANALLSQTFTCAAGTHTVNISTPTGGDFFLMGIETYTAATKAVHVYNMGYVGAGSGQFNQSGQVYTTVETIATYDFDLSIINLSINDIKDNLITSSTYASRMTTLITACASAGDVILCMGNRVSDSADTDVRYGQFKTALAGVRTIDLVIPDRWGNYTAANGLGYMNVDGIHPNDTGSNDMATALLALIG